MTTNTNPAIERLHAESLLRTTGADLGRHAAVHGFTVEAMTTMVVAVEGDRLLVPLWADRKLVGLRSVGLDGSVTLVDGSLPGIYRTVFGAAKPGVMVTAGVMDTIAMVSAGCPAIGLFSGSTTYRIASLEIEESARQQAVVWSMEGFARHLLMQTPAGLERVTVCVQPQEHESVAAWVRDGKADRKAILDRVAQFRRMWDREGGQVAV